MLLLSWTCCAWHQPQEVTMPSVCVSRYRQRCERAKKIYTPAPSPQPELHLHWRFMSSLFFLLLLFVMRQYSDVRVIDR